MICALQQASAWIEVPFEMVDIQLRHGDEEQISLSWHLTALERKRVIRSIDSEENQRAFARFQELVVGRSPAATVDGSAPDQAADQAPLR